MISGRGENSRTMGESVGPTSSPAACDRPDLLAWAENGGPLPVRLAEHVQNCPGCRERVRRANRVHAGLMLLRTAAPPRTLSVNSHGLALRMLARVTRASQQARELLTTRRELSRWEVVRLYTTRVSMGLAAAVLLLVVRTGVMLGINTGCRAGQDLANVYWDHVDPEHEWINPNPPHQSI